MGDRAEAASKRPPVEREVIHVDVLIVGGGPTGLAAAIRLADLARSAGNPIEILLIEKGSTVGAHSISGAVVNPSALRELLPDVAETDIPFESPVTAERIMLLTGRSAFRLPFHPPYMGNGGYYVASLGKLTRWLAGIADQRVSRSTRVLPVMSSSMRVSASSACGPGTPGSTSCTGRARTTSRARTSAPG
jgi:flavin-dependent dehydrogenase